MESLKLIILGKFKNLYDKQKGLKDQIITFSLKIASYNLTSTSKFNRTLKKYSKFIQSSYSKLFDKQNLF